MRVIYILHYAENRIRQYYCAFSLMLITTVLEMQLCCFSLIQSNTASELLASKLLLILANVFVFEAYFTLLPPIRKRLK